MVTINAVRASNVAFKATGTPGMVAVFAGATSGIGMGTLKAFIKYANAPKAYIIGRSEPAAGCLLKDLKLSNPSASLNFLEGEISLIKEVDRLCNEIKRKEEKVDIVFLSAGYLSFDDRNVRRDFNMIKAASSGTTQTTLAFEELAKSNSRITFFHNSPGFVDTGAVGRLMFSTTGFYAIPSTFFRWVMLPFLNLFATSVEEAGERGLFLATSAKYPPAEIREGASSGVKLPAGVEISRSLAVDRHGSSNGVYRLTADDESAPDGDILPDYRKNNAGRVVWESTMRFWEGALEKA
ncbi:uncharacterized protein EAE97_000775 [Botrytis byssoidea]|uniref:NAD(P)-binding domain-containing protein n=1 Tax=Botrytis byssoidea TaxID=139641 RepID=A0A9P5IW12_9HELO|nr:uncharacterized protein EAE97_000775 [Botrytis byssoidea]KAF7955516.1 hypothetical protein EAE97_000775 [Botrytis byssoidea]